MTWTRFDSGARRHAKAVKAGNDAAAFWMWAIEWSNENETDGFIDESNLHLLPPNPIKPKAAKDLAEKCVKAILKPGGVGLFEREEGGYRIHDFHDYQPPSDEDSKKLWLSEVRSKAGRKGASKRWQKPLANDGELLANDNSKDANVGSPHAPARGPGSGSDLEGGAEGDGETSMLGQLAKAYADGIADGAGEPWRMPDANVESGFVLDMLQLHKPNLRGKDAVAWVKRSAGTYRRAMAEGAKFQRGFRPSKWADWLNAGRPSETRIAAGVPRQAPAAEGDHRWIDNMSEEDRAAMFGGKVG